MAPKESPKRLLSVGDGCTAEKLVVEPLEIIELNVREAHDCRMRPGACKRKAECRKSCTDWDKGP